jgi:uncharacterized protein (TIGR02246 family)
MKKLLTAATMVFLSCLAVGCQQSEEAASESATDVGADIQAIKDIVSELNAALNAADIDRILSFYADDAIRIPPNEPAAIGKEAVRASFQQMFDEIDLQENDVVEGAHVSGDLAVVHVVFTAILTLKVSGESENVKGNKILVFKKQPGDSWSCSYSIWSDESLIYPTEGK